MRCENVGNPVKYLCQPPGEGRVPCMAVDYPYVAGQVVDHPDIQEFINWKVIEEQKQVIEEQKKAVADAKSREEKMPDVGYKNGFYLETPDGNFSLKIGGRVDADMRLYNSDHPENNQFFVNRARIYLSGTLFKYYEFKIEPDFGKGTSELKDGFINVNYVPYAQFKVGQFKEPFSLERMASANYMDFVERSLPGGATASSMGPCCCS